MLTELVDQFDTSFEDFPAKVFPTTIEAQAFTAMLARLEISHRVILDRPPSRLKLPMQTIVVLIGWGDGVRH
jgi:hypothetical protein